MNIPSTNKNKPEIPEEAKGNPVYEQTRQDMPLWCCGRNCARNSRFVVLALTLIGIGFSIWACVSPKYFSFVSLRNDTFYEPAKAQPQPFEYATEANVGLFKYEILDVFVYPWPPKGERALFDKMLLDELRRMQADTNATDAAGGNATEPGDSLPFGSNSTAFPPDGLPLDNGNNSSSFGTDAPTLAPTPLDECLKAIKPGPGSVACGVSASPTAAISASPTPVNPNDIVAETVDIGVVKPYPKGIGQFDSTFTHAQKGAILGPVFAFIGTLFSLMELCFCVFKCSWLPGALFLYLAFMFQLFTLFLFLSEDWCKYDQDCALGAGGYASVVAIICYMIAQNLLCCSPRPHPYFNMCKKKTVTKKKKKKKEEEGDDNVHDEDEGRGLTQDYDDPDYDGQRDSFRDEPGDGNGYGDHYDDDGYGDPYDDHNDDDGYEYSEGSYREPSRQNSSRNNGTVSDKDVYSSAYDNDTYGDGDYDDDTYQTNGQSYRSNDGGTSYYNEDDYDDYDSHDRSRSGY